MLTFFVATVLD